MREFEQAKLSPAVWSLLRLVRAYLRNFPFQRGKGVLLRNVLLPALPAPPATFRANLIGGGQIDLLFREALGWSTLVYGPFEAAELTYVLNEVRSGDVVLDIGANVGIYSIALGRAVGAAGRVIAFEPVPANVERLGANLRINELSNVTVVQCAAGCAAGSARINLSDDAAYPSLGDVAEARGNAQSIDVAVRTVDEVWAEQGRPPVRFVKVDVEGFELEVLKGMSDLLARESPILLLEANSESALYAIKAEVGRSGYKLSKPPGFTVHNFIAARAKQ